MSAHLVALCVDAADPTRLSHFWSGLLGWPVEEPGADGSVALRPDDDTGFRLRFLPAETPKVGQNPQHLDLTSTSREDQQQTVARALGLGAQHVDVGQRPDEPHVVLADPDGNEFCVIEPGNSFLAGCGRVGAVACDGSSAVGHFWAAALGWPLVWDQDQETAVRAPHGGPKISWGGPPLMPRTGRSRLHLDVAPPVDGDQRAEVERLLALGATPVDLGRGAASRVVLADPDGREFCVLTPQASLPTGRPPGNC